MHKSIEISEWQLGLKTLSIGKAVILTANVFQSRVTDTPDLFWWSLTSSGRSIRAEFGKFPKAVAEEKAEAAMMEVSQELFGPLSGPTCEDCIRDPDHTGLDCLPSRVPTGEEDDGWSEHATVHDGRICHLFKPVIIFEKCMSCGKVTEHRYMGTGDCSYDSMTYECQVCEDAWCWDPECIPDEEPKAETNICKFCQEAGEACEYPAKEMVSEDVCIHCYSGSIDI